MPKKSGPQVSKLHIDRRIRRILLFEISFVIGLYALLFFVSSIFLGQQSKVTDQILSRFQMTSSVQSIERLMILNSNLVRSYQLHPDDKKFEALAKNHSEFADLLDKTKDRLDTLNTAEARQLNEEIKLSDQLIKNYLTIVSTSNALIGKSVLSTVASHKARNTLNKEFPTIASNKPPAELEQDLLKLEEDSINIAGNWRTLVEQDITRLKDRLTLSQQLRTGVLVLQALLVIIALVVISYTYVLPSFEKILKQVIIQNEELLRADGMKTEFISIASHQLRTPLSVIKWALAVILKPEVEKNLEPSHREMLAQAKISADNVIALVGNLLNLSRIEQGRLEHHPQPTNIVPIIQNIIKDMQPIAERRKVALSTESPSEIVELTVDPLLFKEVIQNLVDNAIAYNRENGMVKIIIRKKERSWVIYVADTGYGIPPEDMKNLFTKFYRGANARTIRPNGSGIGLYFIKKIMQIHGGKIRVESEPNQGTIFTLVFPFESKIKAKGSSSETHGLASNIASQTAITQPIPTTPPEAPAPPVTALPEALPVQAPSTPPTPPLPPSTPPAPPLPPAPTLTQS